MAETEMQHATKIPESYVHDTGTGNPKGKTQNEGGKKNESNESQ